MLNAVRSSGCLGADESPVVPTADTSYCADLNIYICMYNIYIFELIRYPQVLCPGIPDLQHSHCPLCTKHSVHHTVINTCYVLSYHMHHPGFFRSSYQASQSHQRVRHTYIPCSPNRPEHQRTGCEGAKRNILLEREREAMITASCSEIWI